MKCTKQYEVDSKGNVKTEACVAGGIMWVLRRSWRLRRQISLDYYTIPPATQAIKTAMGLVSKKNNSASASRFFVNVSGAPNDGFLLNTLKTLFQVFYPEYL